MRPARHARRDARRHTYKCLCGQAPMCLQNLITIFKPRREGLRSNSDRHLLIPKTRCKTFAARSFSVASQVLWNDLPEEIKNFDNLLMFEKHICLRKYTLNTNNRLYRSCLVVSAISF